MGPVEVGVEEIVVVYGVGTAAHTRIQFLAFRPPVDIVIDGIASGNILIIITVAEIGHYSEDVFAVDVPVVLEFHIVALAL